MTKTVTIDYKALSQLLATRLNDALSENDELKQHSSNVESKKKKIVTEQDKFRVATGIKSNGVQVASKKESLTHLSEYEAICQYFLSKGKYRDYMMFTLGVATGLRSSDILSLRIYNVLDEKGQFRERITTIEQKTSKQQDCLITEVMRIAITRYLNSIDWQYNYDDYLIRSNKTKSKLDKNQAYRIITKAGQDVGIPRLLGTHVMRKTFSTIVFCMMSKDDTIDANVLSTIQGLLNHSDVRCTMRYLNLEGMVFDRKREMVSDFLLGKTEIKDLTILSNER